MTIGERHSEKPPDQKRVWRRRNVEYVTQNTEIGDKTGKAYKRRKPGIITDAIFAGDKLCRAPSQKRRQRKERDLHLERLVRRYAERLESFASRAPNNWFNFFDFWSKS